MKKLISLYFLITFSYAFGQTNAAIENAIKIYNSGELDKGIALMEKITNNDCTTDNWSTLVDMYRYRYDFAKNNEDKAVDVAIAIGENMGAKMERKPYTSSKVCLEELLSKCKEAGLYSQCPTATQLLRNYLIDYYPDENITEKALEEFNEAEGFFGKKDYANSKLHYANALKVQANFYKAHVYLADSYWYLGELDSSIVYFRKAIQMHPDLLEPRKYLVDVLGSAKRYEEAQKECIEAICIYPDQSMFMKLADIAKRQGKKYNDVWIKHGTTINQIDDANNKTKAKNQYWSDYKKAIKDIGKYCNDKGVIVKSNSLTNSDFLEVYSWEKMLNENKKLPHELLFAKKMQDENFLDCYVLISEFHFDLYPQYSEFVKGNKAKIKTYIEKYLIE